MPPNDTTPRDPYPPQSQAEETHLWDYVGVVLRRRRAAVAVFLTIVGLATARAFLAQPIYEASTQILIERETPNVVKFKEVSEIDAVRDDYYQTQYKLLQSRALAQRVIVALNLLADPEFGGPRSAEEIQAATAAEPGTSPLMDGAVTSFLGRLSVRPVRNSRLVSVSFEAARADLAAAAANKLGQLYIAQTLEFRYQTSTEAGTWLGAQIDEQRRKVADAEGALQELKEREGIVNIEERRVLFEQQLKDLGTRLNELKATRLQREALYGQMREAANPQELPDVMRSPVVQALRIELASLERQQAQLLERYLDQHPEVIKVRNQIAETRRKLSAESEAVIRAAENDYRAAAAQEIRVAAALETAKVDSLDLSRRGLVYDSLRREVDASKEVLNSLLSRHKETDVAAELKGSNIRIVDPASVPSLPARPRRLRDVLLAAFLGLGLGLGAAFLLDYLDNTIKLPQDVRLHLGAPLLAVIPETAVAGGDPILTTQTAQGRFAEGYRVLRTALNYSWTDPGSLVVLITSTAPGEGKTLTALNLALTLAAIDGKVLLVDGDLRRPRTHALLGRKQTPGLSDVLVGQCTLSEAVQPNVTGMLSYLSAGTSVPSPADLLTSTAIRGLLDGLRNLFRWVIVDTSPVGAVSEPLVLGPLSDGVVCVVGAEMVARNAVRDTLDRIEETRARLLGVVLNRAQLEKYSYYYGGRYYGYYHGDYDSHYEKDEAAEAAGGDGKVARISNGKKARHG